MTKRQRERKGGRYTPPRRTTIATAALGASAFVTAGGQLIGAGAAPPAGAAIHAVLEPIDGERQHSGRRPQRRRVLDGR